MRTETRMTRNLLSVCYSVVYDQRGLSLEGDDSLGLRCVELHPHQSQTVDSVSGDGVFPCQGWSAGSLSTPLFPQDSCCLPSFPPFLFFSAPYCARCLNPEHYPNLPPLFLQSFLKVSHSQSNNKNGALSVIIVSVYCRFHAPPHHEPIFPHLRACVCICKHTCARDAALMLHVHTPSVRACPKG